MSTYALIVGRFRPRSFVNWPNAFRGGALTLCIVRKHQAQSAKTPHDGCHLLEPRLLERSKFSSVCRTRTAAALLAPSTASAPAMNLFGGTGFAAIVIKARASLFPVTPNTSSEASICVRWVMNAFDSPRASARHACFCVSAHELERRASTAKGDRLGQRLRCRSGLPDECIRPGAPAGIIVNGGNRLNKAD